MNKQDTPVRVVFLGNVDSGKSTLVSVLSNNQLDNGRGAVRQQIFNHPHEQDNGRTSSIAMEFCNILDRKSILTDLCGHEKYLKTTLFGLNLVNPDYCIIVVGANMGVSKMTTEHMTAAISLGYRIIVCVTKIDICPLHILKNTVMDIKSKCVKMNRKVFELHDIVQDNSPILHNLNILVPLIKISNVSGKNIDILESLIKHLDTNRPYPTHKSPEFLIDNVYSVKGVGIVLAGTINKGILSVGQSLFLNLSEGFTEVSIRSIFNDEDSVVKCIHAGQHCTVNIRCKKKDVKKKDIRVGMVMVSKEHTILSREFRANIYIFHHSTTILPKRECQSGYQPVIHCNGIRQSAEIIHIENKNNLLRSNQQSIVHFRFRYHDEYIVKNSKFIFREGNTRGIGKIIEVM